MRQIKLKEDETIQLLAPEGFNFTVRGAESESVTNITITQYRDADFETKYPEYPQCIHCRKAIIVEIEKYYADENDIPYMCEKCCLEKLPTMFEPKDYDEWLDIIKKRLPHVIKNLPLLFEIIERQIKKELMTNPRLIPMTRFCEIVTDLGLKFVVR